MVNIQQMLTGMNDYCGHNVISDSKLEFTFDLDS